MIHLDRSHSSAIAHPKANLILPDSAHSDQHNILSWSAPPRDGRPFYHEHQDPFLAQDTQPLPIPSDTAPPNKDLPSIPPSALGPITPGDTEDPKLPEPSPSSPADPDPDPDASSPVAQSTSSLSPPPDTATPSAQADADHAEVPSAADQPSGEDKDNGDGDAQVEAPAALDNASRQSTPLSELTTAPDLDDVPESEAKGWEEAAAAAASEDGPAGSEATREPDAAKESASEGGMSTNAHVGPSSSKPTSPRDSAANQSSPPATNASIPQSSAARPSSSSTADAAQLQSSSSAVFQHVRSSSTDASSTSRPSTGFAPPAASSSALDPKVVTILELNEHLLRISMELQARGIPMNEAQHQQYATRLQSNLTWLAAAADESRKVSQSMMALPIMQPPPFVDFASTERIQQLYAELPSIFAKEISRRQQMGPSSSTQLSQPSLPNGTLKRDRPDESIPDLSNKRRDTGETKAPPLIAPVPPIPHPAASQLPHNLPPAASSPPSVPPHPASQMRSPSMPPPGVPPGMVSGTNDAQLAAARERTRQMQMQQAMRQQQQQQQQQQQHAEGSRQMSPPAIPQQPNVAGPSSMPPINQLNQQQIAALTALGPQAVQNYQILQNPQHPFVQYLVQQVPGFLQLPLQQQLHNMQRAQIALQRQQQMQRAAAQSQAGGSMQGFIQGGMPSFPSGGMSAPQAPVSGSPTRVSPVSHQSPVQGQPSANAFPFTNHGPNPGMEPRSTPGLTPQQQAALANLPPQQRQFYLMQQQMMRGGNGSNQAMMNPQMVAAAQERMRQEQRMAAAGMAHHAGSPIPGGMDGSQFPALRSNPGVPGIARSSRTPSDHTPSPAVSQRMSSQASEEYQRAVMMQQAQQRGMTPHLQQNAGFAQMNWPQTNQPQVPQGQGPYGMSPPNSAGATHGGGYGGLPGGGPSSAQSGGHNWPQNAAGGQFPFVATLPAASQHHSDTAMTPRQASATPIPHQQMSQNSPSADQAGLSELDMFNWMQ